jgi:hypothetical protein
MKIQEVDEEEEEALRLLSGSGNSSLNNINLIITLHIPLIFKE